MSLSGGSEKFRTRLADHLDALFAASTASTPAPSFSQNVLKKHLMFWSWTWYCILALFLRLNRTPLEAHN